MSTIRVLIFAVLAVVTGLSPSMRADETLTSEAKDALRRSVEFFHKKVASHGGYVYRVSADLTKREGEEKAGPDTVWVQPPGTPAVGLVYLEAYERTHEKYLLDAAKDAGECLVQGQLRSGGWAALIDLSPEGHAKYAYRVDPERPKKGSNWTTFDDNKTQSALTFLMRLDQTLGFNEQRIHEATLFALDSVLKAQYPNGAWPQGYQEFPDPAKHPVRPASFPAEWPRQHPGINYQLFYTFNDNAIADTIEMLFLASRIYQQPKYRDAAIKAGGFILLAQLPAPQSAWAQQYDFEMHPVWARKFEPPAISGGESQGIIRALQSLYVETGDKKFLEPIPKALVYLRKSQLPDGKLARFYELQTNKPLYFTKQYVLTYDDSDVPTHYGFKVSANLDRLAREQSRLDKLSDAERESLRQRPSNPSKSSSVPPENQIRAVVAAMDDRGAWVEEGRMRNFGSEDPTRQVIDTSTFLRNMTLLSRYVGAQK